MPRRHTSSLSKPALLDTPQTFGLVTKVLHWTIAALMIVMIIVGFLFANGYPAHDNPLRPVVYNVHKNTGITIFLLASLWMIWRMFNPHPTLNIKRWQAVLARINFIFLFIALFLFPLTGVGMLLFHGHDVEYFHLIKIIGFHPEHPHIGTLLVQAHHVLAYMLLASLGLHLAGFLYHLYEGNDEVKKML